MLQEAEIGGTIRRLRMETGLTLTQLAAMVGVTKGYLSKVENSPKAPPVSTLVNIARALGVSMSTLFGEDGEPAVFSLVRRHERVAMAMNATPFGYTYETLADRFPGRRMEPYMLTIPANTTTTPDFRHEGEEFLLVLKGALRFFHGGVEYLVEEGDSIYFDSGLPHRSLPVGEGDVECLIVIFAP